MIDRFEDPLNLYFLTPPHALLEGDTRMKR
jgi:hypothetical protein